MNTLRWLLVVLLTAAALLGCEADSGSSNGSSAEPGDVDSQGDTSDGSSADTAPSWGVDAASADTTTAQDVLAADTEVEMDTVGSTDDGGPATEDTSIGDLVVGEGACTNDSDLAVLADFDIAAEQMTIGMACYDAAGGPGQTSADEVMACFVETLSTDYGFSLDCSHCVTNQLMCLQEFCMEACMGSMMSGQTSPECEACIEANGCKSDFAECSGVNPNLFSP
jgi:hypothetical protein